MDAIRLKDKLFLAVAIPVALAAAYVYFWRADAARRLDALAREDETLVRTEDFPMEQRRADALFQAAEKECATERAVPMPATEIKAGDREDAATRELAVLGVLRQSGLEVLRSDAAEKGDAACADVLRATGARPEPVLRTYAVRGSYPLVLSALRLFAERKMAVLPDRIEMNRPGEWKLMLWQ